MITRWLAPSLALLLCACSGSSALPPEAFGMFENRNDPVFQKRLDMSAEAINYSLRPTLSGARGGGLSCRAQVPDGLSRVMRLDLNCDGTRIPFKFEYRPNQGDWILTEEDAAPEIFGRLET